MPTEFDVLRRLYDNDDFAGLIHNPDGIYWLKLRSLSRTEQLKELCRKVGIKCDEIPNRSLLAHVYKERPNESHVDSFIRNLYETERSERRDKENHLISQLYQMKVFDWGGLFQNSLEQTIVNNYVKKIQDWDTLNQAIDNELHASMRGYVRCSWYNHWTSIIIEDIFRDHQAVLPAIGLVKRVDFFIHNFPFDLKVTYFPDGYMRNLRQKNGLRPEFTELKRFCRQEGIWFDQGKPENVLFPELLAKITEHPSSDASDFMSSFKATRNSLITETMNNPTDLKVWLYENQGIRRFDAANRFFLVLVDTDNLEESWKLKRNKKLLTDAINSHLNTMNRDKIEDLKLEFEWENETYTTYADILFIIT
jgi:hypothetical protein